MLGDGDSGTPDDHDTPAPVHAGGALARVGVALYAIPGGGSAALWRFNPLDDYRDKLRLDHVAFTVQETATQGNWYNLSLDEPPPDFGVSGAGNVWVGGAATAWTPDPTVWPASSLQLGQIVTHTTAAFLDPDRALYRLTARSAISAGYTTYQPDVRVPGDYASIQDAILSGANRVLVDAGQYAQAFYLLSGVEVIGPRADRALLAPPPGHTGPLVTAEGVVGATVKGFTLYGDDRVVGMRAAGGAARVTLARNILRGTTTAVEVHGADTHLEVVNNTIVGNAAGLTAYACALPDVRNTIFAYNAGAGLTFEQPPPDPHVHWPFDEEAGATVFADASGNGHDATCSGAQCPTAGAAGKYGSALDFDSVDDTLWAATANPADLQTFTIAAWVYFDRLPNNQIMRLVTLASEKAVLRYDGVQGPGQLHFYATIGGQLRHIRVNNVLHVRRWHHVAGSYDGATLRLYLDGRQVGMLAVPGALGGGTGARLSHVTETLDGKLDEVYIFPHALSAAEIRGLYAGCAGGRHAYNLYWANATDLDPAQPGPAELFLDPRFVDRLAHNYTTDDYSPVIDAGNPTDPHPPGTGERVDIGYIEQGRAAYYVDDDYCAGDDGRECLNDGLTWGVDAFARIQEALDVAGAEQERYGRETAGDMTCRVYHSTDTPRDIISVTYQTETFSSIAVPRGGFIVDVNVHHVRGTHSRVGDLDFILQSPSGTMTRLFAPVACEEADFDLHFDDEAAAAGASGNPPCPPTDGGTYRPAQPLAKYDGDQAAGDWVLHIRNAANGGVGRLDAWGLEICTRETPLPLTVGVGPGLYTETVSMPSYVRLIGVDPDRVVLDTQGAGAPVTFDGAVQAEVSGFTLTGNPGGAGVAARGTAKDVVIQRNLIRDNQRGIDFSAGATGRVSFTTIANAARAQYGVVVAGRGSRVHVENTLIHNHTIGLYAHDNGLILSDYNLLVANTTHFNPESIRSAHDKTASSAGFVGSGDYHLTPGSPARDSASPHAPIPPGGGAQADIGYHELTALPLTVFLGRERLSTAVGAAGLAEVQAAVVAVSDPRAPIAETLPDAWQTVYSDAGQGALQTTWLLTTTPTVAGLQRLYSRAEDSVGNRPEDARVWYSGAFVADDTPPSVQWLAPLPGTVDTALELRAQVWDDVAGQFSVVQVQFEVDGEVVAAEWAAEPWDPAAGQPRVFRAWVTFTLGASPTVIAVAYDKAGHRGESAPLLLTVTTPVAPDVTSPTLTLSSPTEGSGVQPPVLFQGTVTDAGGSDVASVQVSLDNGITWLPAAVADEQWSLTWHPPGQQDFVTYPAQVRARDKAGNTTTLSVTFAIDNVPPTLDTRYGYRSRFWKEANPFHGRETTQPGEHFDYPTEVTIWAGWPWDGSDVEGDTLRYQYAVDQNPDTLPNPYGEWNPLLRLGDELPTAWFTLPGEWYVHLFYRDQTGNIAIQRYGPWYMGNFANTLINCNSRVQTIELDGYLDVANYEWTPNEFLDDDERGMEQGRARQSLYASWDGEGFYLGWQGAWWDVDGEMWAYLDTATLTSDTGMNRTVEYPYQTLPFKADVAIRVRGQNDVELYRPSHGQWYPQYPPEIGQDVSGGKEVKFSLVYELEAIQAMRLLAYAREPSRRGDPPGAVWAMFPTTNPLDGEWNAYYHWNTVCNPLIPINANQPRYTSVALYVAGEVSRTKIPPIGPGPLGAGTLAASLSGGSAPGNLVGPGDQLTYTIALENMETYTTPVMALDVFSPLEGAYTLPVPPLPPGEAHTFTLTQTLPDDLSGLTTLPFSVTLRYLDMVLAQDWLRYRVDSLPPTLTLTSQIVCPGLHTLSGRASDGDGGGIGAVQVSTDRVQWQDVVGLHHWTAQVNVPVGVETLTVWLRAADVFGQAIELPFTLQTDAFAPTLTLALPAYLTGAYGDIGGVATDAGSWIERVEVQIGDEAAPWQSGVVYPANGGEQRWAFTWSLPRADGVPLPVRARVVDAGCNVSLPTPWAFVPVDNVPPVLNVTSAAAWALLDDYLPGGDGAPALTSSVTDGSGVASASVTLVDPLGRARVIPLALDGDAWTFTPQLTEGLTGRYTLRVQARDAAGNLSVSPRYVMQVAEVSLDKTVQPAEDVPLDGVVTYTLVLRNHSAALLAGVVITDPLPAEVTPLTQTVGTAFLPPQDNTLEWGPFTLAGGDTITLSFTARVTTDTLAYGRVVSNTAYVSAPGMASMASQPVAFTIESSPPTDIYLPLVIKR